ncbi:hypothetical protein [Lysinibacillus sp. Bpr_S20]|uniref:hypothetical protein n=1 Tax=Lysinibacillus sp. Bpr_S20 TaxID=2933964 RepID=UPI002012AD8F|nr:hypothetical protein [Lysinibacillus sp. Bpr_S20]MCL1700820.1 hypothetical protein [Lysinibacillus sp. Bpr_S20]
MTTRKKHHGHFSINERVSKFFKAISNSNTKPDTTSPLRTFKLEFEKWKCDPLHGGSMHFITVYNDEIKEALRGIEIINGKVIEVIRKSDNEYKVKFKNDRVYTLSKYI